MEDGEKGSEQALVLDKGNDKATQAVSQEDFANYQSIMDSKVQELMSAAKARETEAIELRADLKIARDGASEDTTKTLDRERDLRRREAIVEERQNVAVRAIREATAQRLVAEAKVKGIEVSKDELLKCESDKDMEIAVLRKVVDTKPALLSKLPQSRQIDRGTKIPAGDITPRYKEKGPMLTEFLRNAGIEVN